LNGAILSTLRNGCPDKCYFLLTLGSLPMSYTVGDLMVESELPFQQSDLGIGLGRLGLNIYRIRSLINTSFL
jgi:hypothetical protein